MSAELGEAWAGAAAALSARAHGTGSPPDSGAGWVSLADPRLLALLGQLLPHCRAVGRSGQFVVVACPEDLCPHLINPTVRHVVADALAEQLGAPVELAVAPDPSLFTNAALAASLGTLVRPVRPPARPWEYRPTEPLNPRYTFDTFVAGPGNRFALAAAVAVAETPGRAYNPLVLYGDDGLGKTHLLHAIGNRALERDPGLRARYLTCTEFTAEFIAAVRDDLVAEFQRRTGHVDLLLIDDISALHGKPQIQQEFFTSCKALLRAGKQVVVTSPLSPFELGELGERMRSAFVDGLTVDIGQPDLGTRQAILRQRAQQVGLDLPDEVVECIAAHSSGDVRRLEGALNQVVARARLEHRKLDLALAQDVLAGLTPDEPVLLALEDLDLADLEGPLPGRRGLAARVRGIGGWLIRR